MRSKTPPAVERRVQSKDSPPPKHERRVRSKTPPQRLNGKYLLFQERDNYYRPQTKLRESNVFTRVCLSTRCASILQYTGIGVHPSGLHPGRGASIWAQDGCTPAPPPPPHTHQKYTPPSPTGSMHKKTNGQQTGGTHPSGMKT